jgi:hypothetical protein
MFHAACWRCCTRHLTASASASVPACSNNMLHAKDSRDETRLLYACHHCPHEEFADNYCIYRNQIVTSIEYVWVRRGAAVSA